MFTTLQLGDTRIRHRWQQQQLWARRWRDYTRLYDESRVKTSSGGKIIIIIRIITERRSYAMRWQPTSYFFKVNGAKKKSKTVRTSHIQTHVRLVFLFSVALVSSDAPRALPSARHTHEPVWNRMEKTLYNLYAGFAILQTLPVELKPCACTSLRIFRFIIISTIGDQCTINKMDVLWKAAWLATDEGITHW